MKKQGLQLPLPNPKNILVISIEPNSIFKGEQKPAHLPVSLVSWLECRTSLTNKLKAMTKEASLFIIKQGWERTNWWEHFTLGVHEQRVMRREITISAGLLPCWYARTVIPEATYRKQELFFGRLKQESLGEIIFNEPNVMRQSLLNYAINTSCIEYFWLAPSLIEKADILWARLSVFTIEKDFPFFLIEIFLPGLLKVL